MSKETAMSKEERVWLHVFCSVASANDCKGTDIAESWANKAVELFHKKFSNNQKTVEKEECDFC